MFYLGVYSFIINETGSELCLYRIILCSVGMDPPTIQIKKICVVLYFVCLQNLRHFIYVLLAKHSSNTKRDFITFLAPQQVGTKQNSTKKIAKDDINQAEKHTIEY